MGFILLLWSLAQTVRAALPLACLGSPPAWALPSPPHIASTLPLNHTPFLPRALTPQLARAQPTLRGQNFQLSAVRPQPDLCPEPHIAGWWAAPAPHTCAGPLPRMSSPPPYPPTKSQSHPSRPVQASPPLGSLLRSCRGTLQLPQHLTQHLQELSSYLASSWFFPCLPPAPLPASPCSKEGPAVLSPFAGLYGCCFPCRCCCSLALGLCSGWTLPLQHPSPLTSWQIHSHPSRPSSKALSPLNSHPHTG